MEAECVRAELRFRDGQNRTLSVRTGAGLGALRTAISELNQQASQVLTELVDSERARAVEGDDDDDDDVGDDDSDEEDGLNSDLQPVAKRSKTS
ncbi:DNA topoisomerase 1-like isoform X2 [Fundulus heteroclitus]|uniref:DNA topoisomerase 1-like isoform X2 n=1 Tax=Fundulus heteroclitus TaxID=8078 RepID=UPI00165CBF85|nr:DNA topoisomerase 1-like isoform X2 [Fundulus heteroclitus]